ncbi:MAG: response regulator [Bdellovibrionales bacterium]|nr:response regulator [Bdellovibrionales bacterium]
MTKDEEHKKSLQVVVVDDSEFTRKSIVDALEEQGIAVVGEANSAETAAKLLRTTSGNCYIIDIVMPETSGFELAKIINEENKDHFIILMSSLKTENIIIEAITNGACDFLQKPFSKQELYDTVMKVKHELENVDELSA